MNIFKVSKNNKKFTLIELIVIIGILGILTSLVLSNIKGIESEAKGVALSANRKTIQTAVDMYLVDHVEKPVLPDETTSQLKEITIGDPGIINVNKLYPEYLREFSNTTKIKYWLDYTGKVWASLADVPIGLTNTNGDLSWDAVDGAVEYIIYEYSEPNPNIKYNLTEIARVNETSYPGLQANGKYLVQSVDDKNNKSVLVKGEYLGYPEDIYESNNNTNESIDTRYNRTLTIDSSKIDEDLVNYPVMVKLDSTNFDFSKVREDGYDIAFYDKSNNLLDFEIDYFNKTDEKAVYHIRIPKISSSLDTDFNIRYGNLEKSINLSNPESVWDEDYIMVQHMGENLIDSTSNSNNGINYGTTVVESDNGKGRSLFNNYINFGFIPSISNPTGNKFTVTIVNKYNNGKYLFTSGGQTGSTGVYLLSDAGSGINTNNKKYKISHIDNNYSYKITSITYNGSGYKQFENNKLIGEDLISETIAENDGWIDTTVGVPNNIRNNYFWNGIVDEIRVSKRARSDAWIKANNYNLNENNLIILETEK